MSLNFSWNKQLFFVLYLKYKNKILKFMETPLTVEATVRRDHNAITIYMCESRKSRSTLEALGIFVQTSM